FADAHLALARAAAEEPGQHVLEIDVHLLDAAGGGHLKRGAPLFHVDLHHAVVELAGTQSLATLFARSLGAFGRLGLAGSQEAEQALLGIALGAFAHFVEALFPTISVPILTK